MFVSCVENNKIKNEGKEYYKSWIGYSHPVKLVDKIDSSKIRTLKTYYVGRFQSNNLISVTKYSNDTIVYEFNYNYDSKGKFKGLAHPNSHSNK